MNEMKINKTKFALFVGTRTFFPPKYIEQARTEIPVVLKELGNDFLEFPSDMTATGGIETPWTG